MKKTLLFSLFVISVPSLAWSMYEETIDEAEKAAWFGAAKKCYPFHIENLLHQEPGLLEMRDKKGRTALMIAARHNPDALRWLLEKGAKVNEQDNEGKTALIWATEGNQDSYWTPIKMLLEKGADNHIKDKQGRVASSLVDEFTQMMMNTPEDFNFHALYIDSGSPCVSTKASSGH